MPDAVLVNRYEAATRITYPRGQAVEFCPWLRTESLETHVLVNALNRSLSRHAGPVGPSWRRRLRAAARTATSVDQYAADGRLLASYSKAVGLDEVWRLSLGRAGCPSLEYGMLVFRGPYTICHFQIAGPRTFATCHSRRHTLEEAAHPHVRCLPFPLRPGLLLSLFLMNRGREANRIIVSWLEGRRRAARLAVEVPRLGCRIVCLNRLLEGAAPAEPWARFAVESTHPYDLYTLLENDAAPADSFSMQHIK